MAPEAVAFFVAVAVLSAILTGFVRRLALRRGALDVPNARSSHVRPTPRGGGLAIVVACTLGLAVLGKRGIIDLSLFNALAFGGVAVAVAGYLDDIGRIGIVGRFVVHVSAAVWAIFWMGGVDEFHWGTHVVQLGYAGWLLGVLAIVWALNLFNFMDGIDGIAGSQSLFMGVGGGLLAMLAGLSDAASGAALTVAAASLGFLVWNWPPARVFMGDVGSGYLGFVLAVLALAATRERSIMLAVWLILGGVFFVDATTTLIRRIARRDRFYEAHRSHAYQWQSRRWGSHLRVTLACWGLNLLWLAPWAVLCVRDPARAPWFVAAALVPLLLLAVGLGAGRREA